MKKFFAMLFLLFPLFNWAQEVEQSLSALSFNREGGTMIINYVIPKSDVPVNLQYDLRDVFFTTSGTTYRATTVTGNTQFLSDGKQVIYWEIGRDAPDVFNVSSIEIVIRYTNDTYNRVMDWKRHQEELERQKQLNPEPQPKPQPTTPVVVAPKPEPKPIVEEESSWHRKFRRTQLGIVAGLGTGFFNYGANSELSSELFSADAMSWQVGLVLRTHVTNWLGIQGGAIYSDSKFALKDGVGDIIFIGLKLVETPISLHWNWGSHFNVFGGYNYQFRQEGYFYQEGGVDKETIEKDSFLPNGAGWFYGAELRGKHYGFSVKYQFNKQNTWSADSEFPRMEQGAWWLNYTFLF